MIRMTVDLYKEFGVERKQAKRGYLNIYRHEHMTELQTPRRRPAMLVFPGGGYEFLSQREGEPVAMTFYGEGYHAFMLDYDLKPVCYPAQIEQAAMAMMYIRHHAEEFAIQPDKIAAIGFSAGGHLCGCVSVLWDDPAVRAIFGDECELVRPDASVFSYAVVSCDPKIAHMGSFFNFCGQAVEHASYSIDRFVRPTCSPAFIWANTPDDCVPAINSALLYEAYLRAGVPVELHIFSEGWHGMSLCNAETENVIPVSDTCVYVRSWLGLCLNFLRRRGFDVR